MYNSKDHIASIFWLYHLFLDAQNDASKNKQIKESLLRLRAAGRLPKHHIATCLGRRIQGLVSQTHVQPQRLLPRQTDCGMGNGWSTTEHRTDHKEAAERAGNWENIQSDQWDSARYGKVGFRLHIYVQVNSQQQWVYEKNKHLWRWVRKMCQFNIYV